MARAPRCKGRLVGPPKEHRCLSRTTHESGYCQRHRRQAPPKKPAYHCDLCGHHMDSHFRNKENCLKGGCKCVAYTKLEEDD